MFKATQVVSKEQGNITFDPGPLLEKKHIAA